VFIEFPLGLALENEHVEFRKANEISPDVVVGFASLSDLTEFAGRE
jgi:hypothetical protein